MLKPSLLLGFALALLVSWQSVSLPPQRSRQARATGLDLTQHTITSGGLERTYHVFVPRDYDGSRALPVVVCFHGGGGSGLGAASRYGVVEEAERRGWVAVFPDGTLPRRGRGLGLRTWNGGGCCGSAVVNDVDDVGFFEDLLDQLEEDYAVDRARVFATGMSNGGIMSYRIAVDRPDLVAAIAPVAGALETTAPGSPVPIVAIHGALDENVPIEGGYGDGISNYSFNSQADSIGPFLAANGGTEFGPPEVIGDALLWTFDGGANGADTWYLLALDGGHTWPGSAGSPIDATEPVHTDVPATPLIFDFFELQFP